jgi:hypothetical protein
MSVGTSELLQSNYRHYSYESTEFRCKRNYWKLTALEEESYVIHKV